MPTKRVMWAARHKYGATACVIDGFRFASQREGTRYQELKLAERGGYIVGLELHPRFELRAENGGKVGVYVADFAYWQKETLTYVVEDVKGFRTPVYKLKKRHFEAQYGMRIVEV